MQWRVKLAGLDRDLHAREHVVSNGGRNQQSCIWTYRFVTTLYPMVKKLVGLYRDLQACRCIVATGREISGFK
jgi:hypothetical protein